MLGGVRTGKFGEGRRREGMGGNVLCMFGDEGRGVMVELCPRLAVLWIWIVVLGAKW